MTYSVFGGTLNLAQVKPKVPVGHGDWSSRRNRGGGGVCYHRLLCCVGGVQHIARGRVKLVRQLGEGQFGSVYLGVCDQFPTPSDVTTVAVKAPKIPPTTASGLAAYDEILRDFEREAELLDGLRHESIVSLYGMSIDQEPLLILEYMENGDLNKFLR